MPPINNLNKIELLSNEPVPYYVSFIYLFVANKLLQVQQPIVTVPNV